MHWLFVRNPLIRLIHHILSVQILRPDIAGHLSSKLLRHLIDLRSIPNTAQHEPIQMFSFTEHSHLFTFLNIDLLFKHYIDTSEPILFLLELVCLLCSAEVLVPQISELLLAVIYILVFYFNYLLLRRYLRFEFLQLYILLEQKLFKLLLWLFELVFGVGEL